MDYLKAALAILSIPLWFGTMLYLFIKDEDTEGVRRGTPSVEQEQERRKLIERKRRK